MGDIQGKHAALTIDQPEMLHAVAHALSSTVRVRIVQKLGKRSMSVGELAEEIDAPMPTTANVVKILEEMGIIATIAQPARAAR